MDAPTQPSFIPKKAVIPAGSHSGGSWLGILLFLIASLIFTASLVGAGGAFLYQKHLQTSIVDKSDMLKQTEQAFDPSTIQDLLRLDSRINTAQTLLGKHTTVFGAFNFLAQETIQAVQFTSFGYELQEGGNAVVSLAGVADGFATVALQSDRFGNNKLLKDVAFSGVTLNSDGRVNFTVKITLDPMLINYAKNLALLPQGSQTQVQTQPQTPIQNSVPTQTQIQTAPSRIPPGLPTQRTLPVPTNR